MKIPTLDDSQATLKPIQTSPLPREAFGDGSQIRETAKIYEDFNNKFTQITNLREKSEALLEANSEIEQATLEAETDDPKNVDKYASKVSATISDKLSKISDPIARLEAQLQFESMGQKAISDIRSKAFERNINYEQANYMTVSGRTRDSFLKAGSGDEANAILNAHTAYTEGLVRGGVYKPTQAQQFHEANKKWWQEKAELMMDADPDNADRYIEDYSRFAPLDAVALKDKAIQRKEKIAKVENRKKLETYTKSETEVLMNIPKDFNDEQYIEYVRAQSDMGQVRPEFAQALYNYIADPSTVDLTNNKGFSYFVDNLFATNDKKGVNDLLLGALQGDADKKLSREEMGSLIKIAHLHSQGLTLDEQLREETLPVEPKSRKKAEEKIVKEKKVKAKTELQAMFKVVNDWLKNADVSEATQGEAYKSWVSSLDPANPTKSTDSFIKQMSIGMNPEIKSVGENGKLMRDKHGNVARVFPDGRIEEVK